MITLVLGFLSSNLVLLNKLKCRQMFKATDRPQGQLSRWQAERKVNQRPKRCLWEKITRCWLHLIYRLLPEVMPGRLCLGPFWGVGVTL